MSESAKPRGIASGKATSTMASAMRKPLNTIGKLETMTGGLKKRRRNLLEFHAWTHSCCSRSATSASRGETEVTGMAGMPSMSLTSPSASS